MSMWTVETCGLALAEIRLREDLGGALPGNPPLGGACVDVRPDTLCEPLSLPHQHFFRPFEGPAHRVPTWTIRVRTDQGQVLTPACPPP